MIEPFPPCDCEPLRERERRATDIRFSKRAALQASIVSGGKRLQVSNFASNMTSQPGTKTSRKDKLGHATNGLSGRDNAQPTVSSRNFKEPLHRRPRDSVTSHTKLALSGPCCWALEAACCFAGKRPVSPHWTEFSAIDFSQTHRRGQFSKSWGQLPTSEGRTTLYRTPSNATDPEPKTTGVKQRGASPARFGSLAQDMGDPLPLAWPRIGFGSEVLSGSFDRTWVHRVQRPKGVFTKHRSGGAAPVRRRGP